MECLQENENGGDFPWIRVNDNYIRRSGQYIGEGESIVIEKKSKIKKRNGYNAQKNNLFLSKTVKMIVDFLTDSNIIISKS